jgi:long-subunit fatty acid transport protein
VGQIPLRNTLNPRVSIETVLLKSLTLSSGYQYRPTPVTDLSGTENYLDSNAHIVGLSLSHTILESDFLSGPAEVGIYGQYHWLTRREVIKSSPAKGGLKDYSFQGNAAIYGLCLQTAL